MLMRTIAKLRSVERREPLSSDKDECKRGEDRRSFIAYAQSFQPLQHAQLLSHIPNRSLPDKEYQLIRC